MKKARDKKSKKRLERVFAHNSLNVKRRKTNVYSVLEITDDVLKTFRYFGLFITFHRMEFLLAPCSELFHRPKLNVLLEDQGISIFKDSQRKGN